MTAAQLLRLVLEDVGLCVVLVAVLRPVIAIFLSTQQTKQTGEDHNE